MKTNERWCLVPSLEGVLASSEGRLMVVPFANAPGQGGKQYGGVPTTGQWDGKRFVWRWRGKTYRVHRLICEAFHGPPPTPEHVCMHLDENAAHNHCDNLQWGTQKENLNAPGFLEYCRGRTGDNSPTRKAGRSG